MQKVSDELIDGLNTAEKNIMALEKMSIETVNWNAKKRKRMKKTEEKSQELCLPSWTGNIHFQWQKAYITFVWQEY